ncbi:hypothetical protein AArcSl_2005 [Halalkaliarchaeum desulfuricum]|uniref:DUF8050 domain-containing protein n=1 Tax=Halalkaliarchaeum desulfuricum TaxID=2055893 RepID=A0A343TKK8_9EURY|nr:TIGR04206 family protein [Halalkaliarchaeum desulfuricum]AUX09630.1 hypothetical protein AArcSl_2005 [Halalkaliarchaeum desulfuricum]
MDDPASPRSASPVRAAVAVVLLGFLPWSVLWQGNEIAFVMAWGLFNPGDLHVHSLYLLLTESWPSYWLLPHSLRVWPVGTVLYGLALASAVTGVLFRREDLRVTGGLLVLAGVAALWVSLGLATRTVGDVIAIPVGAVGLWLVAWWWYGPALRNLV